MSLKIVSRASWGATPWRGNGINYVNAFSSKDCFLVHYHGGRPPSAFGFAVPRNIEKIHLDNGWDGIGYSFAVDQGGVAYEGRGWMGVASACPGFNFRGIHVYVAVGADQKPTAAALNTVRDLYDEHQRKLGRGPRKMKHSDGVPTSCCGPVLSPWVDAGMPRPGGASAPAATTLYPGDVGAAVIKLQKALIAAGARIVADGSYGPATVAAVTAYQKSKNLEQDGIAGPATQASLYAPAPKPAPVPAPTTTLKEPTVVLIRVDNTDPVFASTIIERRWIPNEVELAAAQRAIRAEGGKGVVTIVTAKELAGFGPLVGPEPK